MADIFDETETAMVPAETTAMAIPDGNNLWEVAVRLSKADIIPAHFRGKVENCFIAVEFAHRTGFPAMTVMQNMVPIAGKPSWASTFLIAMINACGKFEPLEFQYFGEAGTDEYGCRAVTRRISTGKELIGADITIGMARAEGWLSKNGSKWLNMKQQMLAYRAATFFARLYVPELMAGMQTIDERNDIANVTPSREKSAVEAAWEEANASV